MNNKSKFGTNLICQALIFTLFQGLSSNFGYSNPMKEVFSTLASLIGASFWIGLVYGFFRLGGLKIEPVESFYQIFPTGLAGLTNGKKDDISSNGNLSKNENAESEIVGGSFDWDKLLSVEYLRYAGALLVFTSVFSLLFKINWLLEYKIFACFASGVLLFFGAEFLLRKLYVKLANCVLVISYVLIQFGATLLFLYEGATFYQNVNAVLLIKTAVFFVFLVALLRYTLEFTRAVFIVISFFAPISLLYVGATFTVSQVLSIVLVLSFFNLLLAARNYSIFLSIINTIFTSLYLSLLVKIGGGNGLGKLFGKALIQNSQLAIDINVVILISFLMLLFAHLGLSYFFTSKRNSEESNSCNNHGTVIFDYIISQLAYGCGILFVTSNIGNLRDYPGATIVLFSSISFIFYLFMRFKGISNRFTEVVLNFSLLISAIGMFLETRGAWSAIVFLIFACVAVYVAIVMGTTRTKVYAFMVLTISIFKLYTECTELFESISGTSIILALGIVLIGLSFKLENVKKLMR